MDTNTPKSIARKLKNKKRPINHDWTPGQAQKNAMDYLKNSFGEMALSAFEVNDQYRDMSPYPNDPVKYCREVHGITLWRGENGADGQAEIAEHYAKVIRQQHERKNYELTGTCDKSIWTPGQTIQTWIRVEAGHTVGKTLLAAMLVNHFFDCYQSVTYTFAPTHDQINNLLFKEIRKAREGRNDLPGKVFKTPRLEMPNESAHWVQGKATGGGETERVHGQHEPYMLFVLDEAEGIDDYVWEAVQSMTGGGIYVVICLANPRTDSSMFARYKNYSYVKSFRLSCIDHPNVLHGKEIVQGAVRRDYVDTMIEKHCTVVKEHQPDYNTFEVPWNPGVIYIPNAEFLFRVLGIAPADRSKNTFCPPARVEAAMKRQREDMDIEWLSETHTEFASIGIDCARYGDDSGKIYTFHRGEATLYWSIYQQDTFEYYGKAVDAINHLYAAGARMISVRVDGGGGYGAGVIDQLSMAGELEGELRVYPEDLEVIIHEIQFQETADTPEEYADLITELYDSAANMLTYIKISDAPDLLVSDLSGRQYTYVTRRGRPLKQLVNKETFRRTNKRSPDDGDGFVLAVTPEHMFSGMVNIGYA